MFIEPDDIFFRIIFIMVWRGTRARVHAVRARLDLDDHSSGPRNGGTKDETAQKFHNCVKMEDMPKGGVAFAIYLSFVHIETSREDRCTCTSTTLRYSSFRP